MDDDLRRDDRNAAQSGAVDDEARVLKQRLRAGRLTERQMMLGVAAGIPSVCQAMGLAPYDPVAVEVCERELPQPPTAMWTPMQDQVAMLWEHNKKFKWGFTTLDFLTAAWPDRWVPATHEGAAGAHVAVVLVPYLTTIRSTMRNLVAAIKSEYPTFEPSGRDGEWVMDLRNVSLLPGARFPSQLSLQWERMTLTQPVEGGEVRPEPSECPHAGVLAVALLHAEWYESLRSNDSPRPGIPGLLYRKLGEKAPHQDDLLCLDWALGSDRRRHLQLVRFALRRRGHDAHISMPEFV